MEWHGIEHHLRERLGVDGHVPAALIATAGSATVSVLDDDSTSNGVSFTISHRPVITWLNPNSALAGAAASCSSSTAQISTTVRSYNGMADL